MRTVDLTAAKAGLSSLIDAASKGEFVTIVRHGKPIATLVSVKAGEIAHKEIEGKRPGLVAYLLTFPGDDFERNASPFRDPVI